jgi:hypothetical protein
MKNQKYAVVMAPDRAFEVLQSSDGDALFFSIGTDNVFYLTREVTDTSTGWNRLDLSSALASQHGGAAVAAKAFSVAQSAKTLGVDLALVVTVSGQDYVYLSLGNANTDASWGNGVTWTVVPFDAGIAAPNPMTIADVFIMNIPTSAGNAVENIFADVVRTPGDPLNLLDRYYITPGASRKWNLQKLAADLAAGSISSCLGQRAGDPIPGIYTFGTINGQPELLFTPQYNYFRPTVAPSPARLTVPAGASAVASTLNASGASNLFVAATGGLYVFTPTNQKDLATPVQVVAGGLVAGASALAAASTATTTAVWGTDPQGALFYVTCPAGREADPAAWSHPLPLLPAAEGFAFYLNLGAGNNVLFAHVDGQNLVQLTQDPVTTDWHQRSILLPPTSTGDVVEYNSFTTHIQVLDDNNVAAPNTALSVTATSPVSVYLNDVYHLLSPTVPANVTTDATGVLTAVQETQSLAAVCFRVALTGNPSVAADINPMSNALTKLGTVQTGDDLSNIQVTNADGSQQPLVPASVPAGDRDAAAKSIAQFVTINDGLPQDGSRQTAAAAARAQAAAAAPAARARTATVPSVWGVSFAGGGLTYHEGPDAVRQFGPRLAAVGATVAPRGLAAPEDLGSVIEVAAGDFFDWLASIFDDVESFVVQEVNGLYHFLATIAGEVYDVLLDCVAAVVHAVEFVFNKIEVFFEDLIKWLGFLFQWGDILRTHAVLKNLFNTYMNKCVDSLGTARADIQAAFTDVQNYLDAWAGIPSNIPPSLSGGTLDGTTSSAGQAPGQDTPQANWGLHHLKSNAASGDTSAQPGQGIADDILSVLQPLADALEREKDVFQAAYQSFKADIIDKIHQLSFPQIVEGVFAIVADALLQSVENVLLAAVDVLVALVEGALDGLNATIDIPVISWVYQQVTGDELSLLDLSCLVAAIPVTICYKLIANAAPFPDNATTSALISAPDWASIQKIINNSPGMLTARPEALTPKALTTEALAPAATISTSDNNICVLTGGIASAVGALSLSIFSPLKQKFPEVKTFSVINGLSYLLYVAPDMMGQIPDLQNAKWWAIFNNTVSDLMVVKSMVDMGVGLTPAQSAARGAWDPVSPWLDFGGNIVWQVPTTAALFDPENQNTAGILSYFGGTCFDCNGVLSPVLADDSEPITWAVFVALAAFFNLAYGAMSCAASVLTFES